jgi:hypothetical protein
MNTMKKQLYPVLIIVIVLAAFHLIAFALPFAKTAVFWLAYVMTVIAILAQAGIYVFAFKKANTLKSKIYGFPIAKVGIIFLIVILALSCVFIILSVIVPIWIEIIVYVLVCAACGAGLIATDTAREAIESIDKKQRETTSFIRTLRAELTVLAGRAADDGVKAALSSLAEKARYSDPVSSAATEEIETQLQYLLDALKPSVYSGRNDDAIMQIDQMALQLDERNVKCKAFKQ